jgi:hypothetical protein
MVSFSPIDIAITSTYKDKGARQAQNSLTKLTKSANKLAGAFGLAFGVTQVTRFAKASIQAFAQEEKSAKSLALTLGNLGLSFETLATEQFIQRIQRTRGILDNELRPAMQQLVSTTLDAKKSQDILLTALDLSAGAGISLDQAVDALTKSFMGNNSALGKLNIGLTSATIKGATFTDIQEQLNKQFAGQGEASASGYAGQMAILGASMDVVKEIIGEGLVRAFEDLNINAQKSGGIMESLAKKTVTAFEYVSKFIKGNALLVTGQAFDKSSFEYKMNFDKPYDPMSAKFDYEALRAQEKKLQEQAAKAAKARLDAIKKEQALVKAQKQLLKDQEKLKKFGTLFDTEQIEIFAALQGKITDQEKLRLSLQLALIQGNATEAERLGKQLTIAQLQTTDLAAAIAKIPKALNPFEGFGTEVDNLIAKILNMYKLLQQPLSTTTTAPIVNSAGGTTPSLAAAKAQIESSTAKLNDFNKRMLEKIATTNKIPETTIEQDIQSQLQSYLAADTAMRSTFKDLNINIAPAGSVVTTGDLVQDIRNALIEAGLSGSQTTINRNLGAFQVQ